MAAGKTLVIGGNGKTGRRVVERLQARNLPVSIGSRTGELPFVWESPDTWAKALSGIESVYVTFAPDLAVPGAPDAIRAFTVLAKQSGVRKLVLLSGRGEPEAQQCEQIVRDSGIDWTILRASWFAQNFSENYFLEGIQQGELALPAGNVGEPFIDVDDIADAALVALTESGHSGQLYELTGPRLLTFAAAVAEIAKETKREIRYVEVPVADYAAVMAGAQLPPDLVQLVTYLFSEVLDGRNAWIADGVTRALGRAPRDFSQYVRETAKTGVWDAR